MCGFDKINTEDGPVSYPCERWEDYITERRKKIEQDVLLTVPMSPWGRANEGVPDRLSLADLKHAVALYSTQLVHVRVRVQTWAVVHR